MLLRSSSTPVLGSLLSSFSDSPNRDFDTNNGSNSNSKRFSPSYDYHFKKMPIFHGGHSNFGSSSCNSSPITASNSGFFELDGKPKNINSTGFRRAQSDGNLECLAAVSCDVEGLFSLNPPLISSQLRQRKHSNSMLQTIPSFSIYSSVDGFAEEEAKEEEGNDDFGIGQRVAEAGGNGDEFSFGENLCLIKEEKEEVVEEGSELASPSLFLARGLGIDSIGGGGCFTPVEFGDGGQDGSRMEEHYKRMVEENPGSPLFLRNYAQFLYQSKGDLHGAEEYYSRAILADPGDGELLSQYAKLVWEVHHDHERASGYFERSVQVAPQDSHVLAAYASFLWETEDENEEDDLPQQPVGVPAFHSAGMTSASA